MKRGKHAELVELMDKVMIDDDPIAAKFMAAKLERELKRLNKESGIQDVNVSIEIEGRE